MKYNVYLKLVRWPNLIIVAITMYFIRHLVLEPFLNLYGYGLNMSHFDFFILVLSTILLAAAGYIINDYFDLKIDIYNKPSEIIIGKAINRRQAQILHIIFNVLAILFGFYLAWVVKHLVFAFVFPVVSGIFWYYSTTYKRMFLVGNVVVAILTALPPLGVLIFEIMLLFQNSGLKVVTDGFSLQPAAIMIFVFSGFAFLINFIREVIKDLEDLHGDYIYGRRTIPVVLGVNWAKTIVLSLIGIAIAVMVAVVVFLADPLTIIYISLLLICPLIYCFYRILKSATAFDFHFASNILKFIMITGIFYSTIIFYILTYKIK